MLHYTKIKQAKEPQLYFSPLKFIKFHTLENLIVQGGLALQRIQIINTVSKSQRYAKITLSLKKKKKTNKKMTGCCVKNIVRFL